MTQEQFLRLSRLNTPCRDNGEAFTDLTRLKIISEELHDTSYRLLAREASVDAYIRVLERMSGELGRYYQQ